MDSVLGLEGLKCSEMYPHWTLSSFVMSALLSPCKPGFSTSHTSSHIYSCPYSPHVCGMYFCTLVSISDPYNDSFATLARWVQAFAHQWPFLMVLVFFIFDRNNHVNGWARRCHMKFSYNVTSTGASSECRSCQWASRSQEPPSHLLFLDWELGSSVATSSSQQRCNLNLAWILRNSLLTWTRRQLVSPWRCKSATSWQLELACTGLRQH